MKVVRETEILFSGLLIDVFELPGHVFDLQRFAAEDEGRTEDPSERRKTEEREKGNVPRSQDLPSAAVLLGGIIVLFFLSGYIFRRIQMVFHKFMDMDYGFYNTFDIADARALIFSLFWETGGIVFPVVAAALVMAVVANVAQVGFLFTLRPLEFKPERMKPDFKKVLPVRRNLYNLGKILFQVAIIGLIAYFIIVHDFISLLKTTGMELRQAIILFAWSAFKLILACGILILLISLPDYFYQRFEYMENLKTTVSESKRERKDEEGDPLVRQRQRERLFEMRNQRSMLQEVEKADVIITNPTHYSVALAFDRAIHNAPVVIAKGTDQVALQIRIKAREHNISIEENPPLARTLFAEVETGNEIPETLYRVVSNIFARLDKFKKVGAN